MQLLREFLPTAATAVALLVWMWVGNMARSGAASAIVIAALVDAGLVLAVCICTIRGGHRLRAAAVAGLAAALDIASVAAMEHRHEFDWALWDAHAVAPVLFATAWGMACGLTDFWINGLILACLVALMPADSLVATASVSVIAVVLFTTVSGIQAVAGSRRKAD